MRVALSANKPRVGSKFSPGVWNINTTWDGLFNECSVAAEGNFSHNNVHLDDEHFALWAALV